MSGLPVILLASGVLVSLGGLAFMGYRLWQLDLDYRQLDDDYKRLHRAVKAVQPDEVRSLVDRMQSIDTAQRHLRHDLGWIKSWVEYWAAPSPEGSDAHDATAQGSRDEATGQPPVATSYPYERRERYR